MGQCGRNLEVQEEQAGGRGIFFWWCPKPHTGGPFSFPPRVRPLGTANGSAPAHWDPHPNCGRAPQGVAVGGSRAPTHAHSARDPRGGRGGEEGREKGEKEGGRVKRAQLTRARSTPSSADTSYCY